MTVTKGFVRVIELRPWLAVQGRWEQIFQKFET